MFIDNMNFVLFFPKLEKIRAKQDELEAKLADYFMTPFTVLPIPEDAPPEIPRIIAKSQNDHSQLTISLINLQLNISFDNEYNEDFSTCFNYLRKRANVIKDIVGEFCDQAFLFSGVNTRVVLDKDIDEPMKFMSQKFVGIQSNIEPYNISSKVAYVLDDSYYLNLSISNVRTYEGKASEIGIKPEVKEISNCVAVEVDINDKFGYNHNKEHKCTNDSITFIINRAELFVEEKLEKVLLKGEMMDGSK